MFRYLKTFAVHIVMHPWKFFFHCQFLYLLVLKFKVTFKHAYMLCIANLHANYAKTKKFKIQTLEINKFVGELNPIL